MPWPVMLVNADLKIQFWNTHSQRLFGFVVKPEVQLSIEQLPMQEEERRNLLRRIQTAMTMQKSVALKVAAGPHSAAYRVQLSPLQSKHQGSVLVMFEPVVEEGDENDKGNKKAAGKNNR
jgi:nitrogen-specific signal transduction histidine kinase